MKIIKLQVERFDIALAEPVSISFHTSYYEETYLVRMWADNGLVGWGEGVPFAPITGESIEDATREARGLRLDQMPPLESTDQFHEQFIGRLACPTLRAALDMAAHDLIADHPEILRHLERHTDAARITTIPYGARRIDSAPVEPVAALGLSPGAYLLVVARLEPENSILEIVRAYAAQRRGLALAVVGPLDTATNPYHRSVAAAASDEVRFLGAVYDQEALGALRFHALAYVHGHTVGGPNPSLVEAMGARNVVIAHDNRFNRWVTGDAARYFRDEAGLAAEIPAVASSPAVRAALQAGIAARFEAAFTWSAILAQYEQLLARPASSLPRPADG